MANNWWCLNEAQAEGPVFTGEGDFHPSFSNFVHSPIKVDGLEYQTVEHYFQAMKTLEPGWRKRIQRASDPGLAKVHGRAAPLRPDWDEVKYEVMVTGLRVKFAILAFRSFLAEFEGPIVEWNTWHDRIWGVCICSGCGHRGQNLLGKALEQVRQEITDEENSR